jgi:hypothetical protein
MFFDHPGTQKTHQARDLCAQFRALGEQTAITASTLLRNPLAHLSAGLLAF